MILKLYSLLFLAFIAINTSCTSLSSRYVASETQKESSPPRHTIFLIHGLGGNENTFHKTGEALVSVLNQEDPSYQWEYAKLTYDTKDEEKDAEVFAIDLGERIHDYYTKQTQKIRPQDKFSFITHSQGGIVGLSWIYMASKSEYLPMYYQEYVSHIDAYISLGTPFWGSGMTSLGFKAKNIAEFFNMQDALPFGRGQLKELAHNSQTVNYFRMNTIKVTQHRELLEKILKQIRPINIGAVTRGELPFIADLLTDHERFNTDLATEIPSARFDFNYAIINDKNYIGKDHHIPINVFKPVRTTPFYPVLGVHTLPLDQAVKAGLTGFDIENATYQFNKSSYKSIVQIGSDCINNINCDHPNFKYMVDHLLKKPLQVNEDLLKSMSTYYVDVKLVLPEGIAQTMKNDWKVYARSIRSAKNIRFAKPSINVQHRHFKGDKNNEVRLLIRGNVKNSYIPAEMRTAENPDPFEAQNLVIQFNHPRLKTREIEVKVQATYSTYVELHFEKKNR